MGQRPLVVFDVLIRGAPGDDDSSEGRRYITRCIGTYIFVRTIKLSVDWDAK